MNAYFYRMGGRQFQIQERDEPRKKLKRTGTPGMEEKKKEFSNGHEV